MTDRIGLMFGQLELFSGGGLRPRLKREPRPRAEKVRKPKQARKTRPERALSPPRFDSCEIGNRGRRPSFGKGLCGKCGAPQDMARYHGKRVHSYCKACQREYMRGHRQRTPMTPEQRMKDNARSYAGVYLRRGKIERKPCQKCGSDKSQMHHHDYSKPLEVEWLCRPCHMGEHYGPESFRSHADGIQSNGSN